jgi:hypothetical protein
MDMQENPASFRIAVKDINKSGVFFEDWQNPERDFACFPFFPFKKIRPKTTFSELVGCMQTLSRLSTRASVLLFSLSTLIASAFAWSALSALLTWSLPVLNTLI